MDDGLTEYRQPQPNKEFDVPNVKLSSTGPFNGSEPNVEETNDELLDSIFKLGKRYSFVRI